MTFPVLARATRDALRDPAVRTVEFVWHGGESTLLPTGFYRKALWLQQQFRRPEQRVNNVIQTNGTRLTDEWLGFLRRYSFSVGVSLDGPPEIHDRRRVDVAGRPTAARVRRGIERLHRAGIGQTGVIMVVDEDTLVAGAERVLQFLLEIGVREAALLNVVPENTTAEQGQRGSFLPLSGYVSFLRDLFHLWYPENVQRIAFREISDPARVLMGGPPGTCVLAGNCFGGFLTVEPTGQISACDKYEWDDDYLFGNLLHNSLTEILNSSARLAVVRVENGAALDRQRECPWFAVCRGACPHDRYTAERRMPGREADCCGLAPLLEDMADTFRTTGLAVYSPDEAPRGRDPPVGVPGAENPTTTAVDMMAHTKTGQE